MSVAKMELYMIYICFGTAVLGAFLEWFYIVLRREVSNDSEVQQSYKRFVGYCHWFSIGVLFLIWIICGKGLNEKIRNFYFYMIIVWGVALLCGVIYLIVERIRKPSDSGLSAGSVAEMGRRCVIRGFVAFFMWWLVV